MGARPKTLTVFGSIFEVCTPLFATDLFKKAIPILIADLSEGMFCELPKKEDLQTKACPLSHFRL